MLVGDLATPSGNVIPLLAAIYIKMPIPFPSRGLPSRRP